MDKREIGLYQIGCWLDNGLATMFFLFAFAMVGTGLMQIQSQDQPEYLAQKATVEASAAFVKAVETSWPKDKHVVFAALLHAETAYRASGENAFPKLAGFEHFMTSFLACRSRADEQRFLEEVRLHGMIVAAKPAGYSPGVIEFAFLIFGCIGVLVQQLLLKKLREMEPRLRFLAEP